MISISDEDRIGSAQRNAGDGVTAVIDAITLYGPRDYVKLPDIPAEWKVVDIGPGGYPLKRANVYIDQNPAMLEAIRLSGQTTIVAKLQDGLPEISDGAFDFAFCSHVLEHCVNVQRCVDTLNRIAKRGCMVAPSFAKESLFHFEERDHFWLVLPNPTHGGPPIFVERNHGFLERLRDTTVQTAACFLYRTGTQHDCTAERYMRSWYQQHEPDLDIVTFWDIGNPLKVIVVR